MLKLPEKGIAPSKGSHNCDLHLFCDWIEGSILFKGETRISRTAILDILIETDTYSDQGFASAWLDNVWAELDRRRRLLDGASPFNVASRAVTHQLDWEQVPAYAFCLLTSLFQNATTWRPKYSKKNLAKYFALQGELFERISEESIRGAGWKTHRTGWSSGNAAKLPAVVTDIAQKVGEPELHNWAINVARHANEAGLDVVFFREFPDGRGGFPIYLAQCAAGSDWDTKLHTPVLSVWRKLLDFAAPPYKAFAIPGSLDAEQLRRITVKVDGLVFDRYRLHDAASRTTTWCSSGLVGDLKKFMKPLIAKLPSYS